MTRRRRVPVPPGYRDPEAITRGARVDELATLMACAAVRALTARAGNELAEIAESSASDVEPVNAPDLPGRPALEVRR